MYGGDTLLVSADLKSRKDLCMRKKSSCTGHLQAQVLQAGRFQMQWQLTDLLALLAEMEGQRAGHCLHDDTQSSFRSLRPTLQPLP